MVSQFTGMIADAAHDSALAGRTRVLLTEAVPGGWGLGGHANTSDGPVTAARNRSRGCRAAHDEFRAAAGCRAQLRSDCPAVPRPGDVRQSCLTRRSSRTRVPRKSDTRSEPSARYPAAA